MVFKRQPYFLLYTSVGPVLEEATSLEGKKVTEERPEGEKSGRRSGGRSGEADGEQRTPSETAERVAT